MSTLSKTTVIAALFFLISIRAEARFAHHFHGPLVPAGTWQHGYWFHGAYMGHAGWWWVLGPSWYYYDSPIYPYPPNNGQPALVMQVPNAPPPPPEPLPGTKTEVVAAPPTPAAAVAEGHGTRQAFSYYCEKTKNYYPLITTCTDGWLVTQVKAPN